MKGNCKITLLNKVVKNKTLTYQKTIIENCYWEDVKGINVLQSGIDSADSARVFIFMEGVENYLPPKDFAKLPDGNFTLQNEDYIIKGEIFDDFSSISEIERKYDFVKKITKVDFKDGGSNPRLHHWEVGAE